MKVDRLVPKTSHRLQFHLRFQKFIPGVPGCYALTSFDDYVLYVGLTKNLQRRFIQHWDSSAKRGATNFGRAFWFYFLSCAEKDLFRIERTWINEYMEIHGELPILNRVNSPVR